MHTEIFFTEQQPLGRCMIYSFTHDPKVKWYLTVEEKRKGRVETYPRFRTDDEVSKILLNVIMV